MKFIIERSKWYRGRFGEESVENNSRLVRIRDDKMCCLGFVGNQCGIALESMLDQSMPSDLPDDLRMKYPVWLTSGLAAQAAIINDNINISDSEREIKIKEIFTDNGDEIEFVD